jgi:hypothetical protein
LLRNADFALYRAKSDGCGTFRFFEPVMDPDADRQHEQTCARRCRQANSNCTISGRQLASKESAASRPGTLEPSGKG